MEVKTDKPLKKYTTMRLGGPAHMLVEVRSKDELEEAVAEAHGKGLPILVLGEGSNIIIRDEGFKGMVIINRIPGFKVLNDTSGSTTIKIGAGEHWDDVVKKTVDMGLSGIEFLSHIPGTAGGTPVQNVGAYGTEISDVFDELEAYDLDTSNFVTLTGPDCRFSYRNSIFKAMRGRHYIITSVTITLKKTNPKPPFYGSLQRYLDEHGITEYTPKVIRDAVSVIREKALPDPADIPSCGSFFKNPLIAPDEFKRLQKEYPDLPSYPTKDGRIKIPAAWLIDRAGLKGYAAHGFKTFETNALVIVNVSADSYGDLEKFQREIAEKVKERFGVTLEREPELL